MQSLPPQLVALVQHIELHQAGWWAIGLQRTVMAALWLADGIASQEETRSGVEDLLGVEVTDADIEDATQALIDAELVFWLNESKLKLAEEAAQLFIKDMEDVDRVDAAALEDFRRALVKHGLDLDVAVCWSQFNELVLLPLIDGLGARTYELITQDPEDYFEEQPEAIDVLNTLAPGGEAELRAAVVDFLDPANANTRSYVLRRLNASFFMKAARLPKETLEALDAARDGPGELIVFVDTNFLFSILALHDNPSNAAAVALLELSDSVSERVDVQFRVLPITVKEARRVLEGHILTLEGLVLSRNLGQAGSSLVSGLTKRYFEAVATADAHLSSKDFFSAYESNLLTILRSQGIELHNAEMRDYTARQDVIDDLLAQEEIQTERRPKGAKPYESNLHDMVLWHLTQDVRPAVLESPIEARYWIVTIDYGFIAFDSYKRRQQHLPLPTCIHPAALTQLLQFWVPRDEGFEAALMGAFRLPFLQAAFDPQSEAMTIRILRRLARYEAIDDLPPEAVSAILENEALRTQLSGVSTPTDEDELIQQAFLDEIRELAETVAAQRQDFETQEAEVARTGRRAEAAEAARDQALAERERLQQESQESEKATAEKIRLSKEEAEAARSAAQRLEAETERLETELRDVEARRQAEEHRVAVRRARNHWTVWSLAIAAVIVAITAWSTNQALDRLDLPPWLVIAAFAGTGLIVALLLVSLLGGRYEELDDWQPVAAVRTIQRWLWGALFALLISILGTAIWSTLNGS